MADWGEERGFASASTYISPHLRSTQCDKHCACVRPLLLYMCINEVALISSGFLLLLPRVAGSLFRIKCSSITKSQRSLSFSALVRPSVRHISHRLCSTLRHPIVPRVVAPPFRALNHHCNKYTHWQ